MTNQSNAEWMVIIIPALAIAAAIYAWSVEEVGVLVGVEDAAANRRPSGAKRECLPSNPSNAFSDQTNGG